MGAVLAVSYGIPMHRDAYYIGPVDAQPLFSTL
jgi:hypothetical protein